MSKRNGARNVLDGACAETRTETALHVVADHAPCVKKREAFSIRQANWEGFKGEVIGSEFRIMG